MILYITIRCVGVWLCGLLWIKEALYRIWCDVHTLGDNSAFVHPAGQLLLTRWGETKMDDVGIVFELYTAPL